MFAFCPDSLKTEEKKIKINETSKNEAVPGYLMYDEQKYLLKN